jgi:hypothetical protein
MGAPLHLVALQNRCLCYLAGNSPTTGFRGGSGRPDELQKSYANLHNTSTYFVGFYQAAALGTFGNPQQHAITDGRITVFDSTDHCDMYSRYHCDMHSRHHCDMYSRYHCDMYSRYHCDMHSILIGANWIRP